MRRFLVSAAATLVACLLPFVAASAASCPASYDLDAIGVRTYDHPILATAVVGLRDYNMKADVIEIKTKSSSMTEARSAILAQASQMEDSARAELNNSNATYAGGDIPWSQLQDMPLNYDCDAGEHGAHMCVAMIYRWESLRMRQLADGLNCYW